MKDLAKRPIPIPNVLTQPFWDGAKADKLVIQRCQLCHVFYQPPVDVCMDCLARGNTSTLSFETVSGKGVIYGHTLVHDTRLGGFEEILPYPVVLVELEEQKGLILNANMPDTDPAEIHSDVPVEVYFIDIGSGMKLPEFRLVNN